MPQTILSFASIPALMNQRLIESKSIPKHRIYMCDPSDIKSIQRLIKSTLPIEHSLCVCQATSIPPYWLVESCSTLEHVISIPYTCHIPVHQWHIEYWVRTKYFSHIHYLWGIKPQYRIEYWVLKHIRHSGQTRAVPSQIFVKSIISRKHGAHIPNIGSIPPIMLI